MKNSPPNAAQKRWREQVRSLGSIISGGPAVIHHCVGRTAKHRKIEIGHFWIIPLTDDEHRDIHAHPNRKALEKGFFALVTARCRELFGEESLPPPAVREAIQEYRR